MTRRGLFLAVRLVIASLVVVSAMAAIGDVISSFRTPESNPWGLTWDGTNLWHSDRGGRRIYQLTTSGNPVSSFSTNSFDRQPQGMAWDSNSLSLWVVGRRTRRVYQVTTSGTVISSFPTDRFARYPEGLTWDGRSLWLVDSRSEKVYRLDTDGTVISSFPTGAFDDDPRGIAWDGTSLWLAGRDTETVYELSPTGTIRSSFSISATDDDPRDLTWDGCSLWLVGRDNRRIYQLSTGTTGTIVSTDPIAPGETVTMTLSDSDLNTNPTTVQTLVLRTTHPTTSEFEDRTYTETGVDRGIFTAAVATVLGAGRPGTNNDAFFNVQAGDVLETTYNDLRDSCGTAATTVATTNVIGGADLTLTKTVDSSTAVPGDILSYHVSHTNESPVDILPTNTVDPVPNDTDYQLGSASFSPGTSPISAVIEFSDDGGATYNYVPASGGGGAPPGFDRNVTHVRYTFVGTLANTAPDNAFDIRFSVRVR